MYIIIQTLGILPTILPTAFFMNLTTLRKNERFLNAYTHLQNKYEDQYTTPQQSTCNNLQHTYLLLKNFLSDVHLNLYPRIFKLLETELVFSQHNTTFWARCSRPSKHHIHTRLTSAQNS